jgi:hypothetical protein
MGDNREGSESGEDEVLTVAGEGPLVFGIQCPWCDTEHYVGALGTKVYNESGDAVDLSPSIGLLDIDGETEKGTVKCWECHRVFQFQFSIIVPDEMFQEDVN